MFGLGKKRSRFGKWMDSKGISQQDISRNCGVGRTTISELCNDDGYKAKYSTIQEIRKALRKLGHEVDTRRFWDV